MRYSCKKDSCNSIFTTIRTHTLNFLKSYYGHGKKQKLCVVLFWYGTFNRTFLRNIWNSGRWKNSALHSGRFLFIEGVSMKFYLVLPIQLISYSRSKKDTFMNLSTLKFYLIMHDFTEAVKKKAILIIAPTPISTLLFIWSLC